MAKGTSHQWSPEVLKYRAAKVSPSTVRKHYLLWRAENEIPEMCDNENCLFHAQPPVWNGNALKLNLDHENGVNSDNRPENLRLLCPNCDSQLSTRGGGNKGRVEKSAGGFAVKRPDGKKDYTLPAEIGRYNLR